ncbi:MAG: ATP-grasp domain-containing protein [Deltaproteobacteria bacterium]|nr:ATP-grasp domain-containing protein [Deltaproteobacteria bacterium]
MNISICYNQVPPELFRGESADRISEAGAEKEALAVQEALHRRGYRPELVGLGSDPLVFAKALRAARPELVFNLCEGFWGDSRKEFQVAALIELLGFTCTGSGPLCLGLTQDKLRAKDLMRAHGLPTPRYLGFAPGEAFSGCGGLAYPLIVKPRYEDASLGISSASVVADEFSLRRRIAYVHDLYRQDALVEEFIAGRELNVAVLGNSPFEVLPLSEIVFQDDQQPAIVGYEGKWFEDSAAYARTVPLCPAPLTPEVAQRVAEIAQRACRLFACRDYARVDFRLRDDIPYILEINANPDLSPDAGLARSAAVAGLTYPDLIERLCAFAGRRKETGHASA